MLWTEELFSEARAFHGVIAVTDDAARLREFLDYAVMEVERFFVVPSGGVPYTFGPTVPEPEEQPLERVIEELRRNEGSMAVGYWVTPEPSHDTRVLLRLVARAAVEARGAVVVFGVPGTVPPGVRLYEVPRPGYQDVYRALVGNGVRPEYAAVAAREALGLPLHVVEGLARRWSFLDIVPLPAIREEKARVLAAHGLRVVEAPDWAPRRYRELGEELADAQVLLYGPPGTGKTLLASYVVGRRHGVMLTPSALLRPEVGMSEAVTESLLSLMDSLGTMVLLDEVDDMLLSRDRVVATDSGVSRRVMAALLRWLGSPRRRARVWMTTNRVEQLDPAAVRPGRMDYAVPLYYPPADVREEALRHFARAYGSEPPGDDVVDETAGLTLAELRQVVATASVFGWGPALGYVRRLLARDALRSRLRVIEESTRLTPLPVPRAAAELLNDAYKELANRV